MMIRYGESQLVFFLLFFFCCLLANARRELPFWGCFGNGLDYGILSLVPSHPNFCFKVIRVAIEVNILDLRGGGGGGGWVFIKTLPKPTPQPPLVEGSDIHQPLPVPRKNTAPSRNHRRSKVSAHAQLHHASDPQSQTPKIESKNPSPHIPRAITRNPQDMLQGPPRRDRSSQNPETGLQKFPIQL